MLRSDMRGSTVLDETVTQVAQKILSTLPAKLFIYLANILQI